MRWVVVKGDITQEQTEAVVTAANAQLAGGGGVDGAIHRKAGPELREACRRIGGCPVGQAVMTSGFLLRAQYVIHAVGPIWHGGSRGEARLLASAYAHALQLAETHGIRTIAFPAISTGAYGYPLREALTISVATMQGAARYMQGVKEVRLVAFSSAVLEEWVSLLGALTGQFAGS